MGTPNIIDFELLMSRKSEKIVQYLTNLKDEVKNLEKKDLGPLCQGLLGSYPRYYDYKTQVAVISIWKELFEAHTDLMVVAGPKLVMQESSKLLKQCNDLVDRFSSIPFQRYVILTWSTTFFKCMWKLGASTSSKESVLKVIMRLVDSLGEPEDVSSGLKNATVREVKGLLRINSEVTDFLVASTLKAQTDYHDLSFLAILLRYTNKSIIDANEKPLIDAFVTKVLGAKSAVPLYVTEALGEFFSSSITEEKYNTLIKPTVDRMLLRAPEVILQTIDVLFKNLSFDLSVFLATQLMDQLIASYQSSSIKTRQDGFKVFSTLCEKSIHKDNMLKAAEKISKALMAKITSWEQRSLVYRSAGILGRKLCDVEVSNVLVKSILLAFPKETHEQALNVLSESLATHLLILINQDQHQDTIKASAALLEKGLKLDKLPIRKAHVKVAGQVICSATTPNALIINACIPQLATIAEKIQSSPVAAGNTVLEGYIALAALERVRLSSGFVALLEKSKYYNLSVYSTPKASKEPTFLVNDRILSKLGEEEEYYWLLRALETIGSGFANLDQGLRESLCQTLVAVTAAISSYETIQMANRITSTCGAASSPDFGLCLIECMKEWLQSKSSIQVGQASRFRKLLVLLFPGSNHDASIRLAISSFILAAHPSIRPNDGSFMWVSLVSQAKLDLPEVVNLHSQELMEILRSNLGLGLDSTWWTAALEGARLLAFISPENSATTLMTMATDYLQQPSALSKEDIAVWKTPKGTMYYDVLKKGYQVAENRKGGELDKWEREVREQLAAKKGKLPKITKEEQELVTAQLAKEAVIRDTVQAHFVNLQNGILLAKGIVSGLKISGILYDLPSPCEVLLARLLVRMFSVVRHKLTSSLLLGQGVKGWLDLAMVCSPELNDLPTLTAVATLRSCGVSVPLEWQGEPLEELLSRLLFRLQMLTSRKPLDAAAFSYMFPLFETILLSGGVGFSSEEFVGVKDAGHDDDQPSLQVEQVTLALNVLGNHTPLCANIALPRLGMAGALLHVIQTQPKLQPTALEYLLRLSEGLGSSKAQPEEVSLLIDGLLNDSLFVRKACLQSLGFLDLAGCPHWANLWSLRFSSDPSEQQLATALWEDNNLAVPPEFCASLCKLLTNPVAHVRTSAANSFYTAITLHPETLNQVFDALCQLYFKLAEPIVPEYDRFGILIQSSLERTDPFDHRVSVALALGGIVPLADRSLLDQFLGFMITQEALADVHSDVRKAMLKASLEAVQHHGLTHMKPIMAILQHTLDQPDAKSQSQDYIREGAVILYGTLARNLPSGSKEIPGIISKLIQTLDTPSESVQFAVAECLPPLIQSAPTTAPALIQSLLDKCINGEKFAERRGAAFGLAGVVKGRGLSALKEFDIMTTIYEAAKSKKPEARQGSMFALETSCELLGRQFEPYVIQTLPFLLICFSDSSDDVRRATLGTSRVIMSKLSGHGIKRTLPSLLEGLDDYQWRTKRGAIELLGSMAYCAPRQLSLSLPTIVPRLIEVLNDSHHMVKGAADSALTSFTDVISNPEIQSLMPQIMDALSDPNAKTQAALKALLDTPFMHYLDAPSLALLVPILQRGLRERSTDIKCKSSQIVGNMASLTDQKDLVPYLSGLMPGLMEILVDPVPEARSTSAKSLGIMVAKLGEINFPDLIQELVRMLRDNASSVDRSGAAQGLSEILSGLDISRMEGLLPEILANTQSQKATTREGFTTMLIYLPATFGLRFKPYLPKVLAPVLNGLADESEYVRDASLRAGQIIITNYSDQAINLLLPELQRGIFEPSWRIRHSSAQLMGDLLFNLMGITVKLDAEAGEDDEETAPVAVEGSRKALLEILGQERRDLVLAGLYLIRADSSAKVRQVSSAIWKLIVSNTPRTLKEILPVVMQNILRFITSPVPERQYMAAGALGDLVRRVGESGLKKILPILHVDLDSEEFEVRKAAVVALAEMIGVLGKSDAADFLNVTTLAVLKALCDPSTQVRETAARTFDILHQHIGPAALEAILPPLLDDLKSDRDTNALEAIQELVSVRANVVLPAAIPSLLNLPISRFDAMALRALIVAGGAAINNRLRMVLPPLMKSCGQSDAASDEAVHTTIEALLAQVNNSGLEILLEILLEWIQSDSDEDRAEACAVMATFFRVAQEDLEILPHVVDWIRILVPLYRAPYEPLMCNAGLAFSGMIKCLDKGDLDQFVIPLRQTVKNTIKGLPQDQDLPGFCQPKAIAPFLSVYLQGLMFSSSDVRERSASSIGDVVARTNFDALKPFVTQITGPLIRIIGERYPASVKVSILDTLYVLFGRAGSAMRPFLPQLQRTFIKSLGDVNSGEVRSRAEKGLSVLIQLLPRVDPLCTELVAGCRSAEESEILLGHLRTLSLVATSLADKLAPATKEAMKTFLTESIPGYNFKEKTCAKSILALI